MAPKASERAEQTIPLRGTGTRGRPRSRPQSSGRGTSTQGGPPSPTRLSKTPTARPGSPIKSTTGTPASRPQPSFLQMPGGNTPSGISLPPSASTTRSNDDAISHSGLSPTRNASIISSDAWLSVKFPDNLSASERVMHHNMSILAKNQDKMAQALVQLAGRLRSENSSTKLDAVDASTVKADESLVNQLNAPEKNGIIRDQLNIFKGTLGTQGQLKNRAGKPARDQVQLFLKYLQTAAASEEDEVDREGEDGTDVTMAGQSETPAEEGPITHLYKLAAGLSSSGLVTWYTNQVTAQGLGPGKRSSNQAGPTAGDNNNKNNDDGDYDDVEESDKTGTDAEQARTSAKRLKKSNTITVEDSDDD